MFTLLFFCVLFAVAKMENQSRKRIKCDICENSYVRSALYRHRKTHFKNNQLLNITNAAKNNEQDSSDVPNVQVEQVEEDGNMDMDMDLPNVGDESECDMSSSDENDIENVSDDDDTNDSSSISVNSCDPEEHNANSLCDSDDDNSSTCSENADESTQQEKFSSLLSRFLLLWQSTNKITNTAMEPMLKFIKILLQLVGNVKVDIKSYRQLLKKNEHIFIKYVVCPNPKCHTLYNPNMQLYKVVEGKKECVKCSHVAYPRHPYAHHRKPCGEPLAEEIKTSKGVSVFRAKKIYCYRRIKDSIVPLFQRTGFEEACAHWTTREVHHNILSDIYDGRVWQSFQQDGYIQNGNDLALMLNVDFFQPFKHVKYSVGVIFLCILNLPREERYKRGNIILVGLIPGPKEPKSLNTYLEPMVDELLDCFESNGFSIVTLNSCGVPLV